MTEKNLARFYQAAQETWSQLPPQARFRPLEDGKVLARYASLMEGWTEEVVQGFYDTLFAHPATKRVFREGERPEREKTLRDWYLRTLRGPFNGQYFAWQALVGLVHVRRGVTNGMMAAMWNWVTGTVAQKARETLPAEEARALEDAWRRLAFTVMALIAEEYLEAYLEALALTWGEDPRVFLEKAQEAAARLLAQLTPS
ncbi:protoglobin domain-containing protein [Thermus sp.]|uniref:protoglobin domain-containing protein n=1 Tax=Thermus sp. TaxID=275 RepID=UPI0025F4B990|nr:protoglobin domain-containing protein [Thermus sp.]MCS6867863.1 protoglobin domain-containing protein [Thermus sp.]MCX7849887.1 protoglobin domain-containing protein [Thermus sp.]MDW8357669.1 protoglobin domain-containing protein [Thermus sp.]